MKCPPTIAAQWASYEAVALPSDSSQLREQLRSTLYAGAVACLFILLEGDSLDGVRALERELADFAP